MSIIINRNVCIGCRQCISICPGNLLKCNEEGKAYIRSRKDCWGCASCVKECKKGAIALCLGIDIGGDGSRMTVSEEGDILRWKIEKNNGEIYTINVNRKEANQY